MAEGQAVSCAREMDEHVMSEMALAQSCALDYACMHKIHYLMKSVIRCRHQVVSFTHNIGHSELS